MPPPNFMLLSSKFINNKKKVIMYYTKITTFNLFILIIGLLTACNDDLSNNIVESNIDTEDVNEFKELFTSKELKDAEPNLVSDIQAEKE